MIQTVLEEMLDAQPSVLGSEASIALSAPIALSLAVLPADLLFAAIISVLPFARAASRAALFSSE